MTRIKNIAIYGSCITKDPFTTIFNENYKHYYNCVVNDQRHSFISTMQEKENVSDEELIILPEKRSNLFLTKCIKEDLERTFIDAILENDIDYIVLDIHFEVEQGIIIYDDNKILTNIKGIKKTKYFSKLKNVKYLNIIKNTDSYLKLWKKYCDKFFNFIKKNSPETKIILAEVRALDMVERENSSRYIEPTFTYKSKINNIYYKILEDYIKENYDVEVISFDKDTVLKEDHLWGKFYLHYDDEYYRNFLKKIDKIVQYDDLEKKFNQAMTILNKLELDIDEDKKIAFYDKGVRANNNENWVDTTPFPMKRTVHDKYTSLTAVNPNGRGVLRPLCNIYDGTTIEFDLYHDSNNIDDIFGTIRKYTDVHANLRLSSINLKMKKWHRIKLSISNDILTMSNKTNDKTRKWRLKSYNRFYFGVTKETIDLKYKNFKIIYS